MEKRKILIRAGMLPTQSLNYIDLIKKNYFGTNVGNLVYQYSVCKTLMTEDVEFIPTGYNFANIDKKKIAKWNETYDSFVIPLADAFREDFQDELVALTNLVKKLKIPCYVIGVGVKAPLGDVNNIHYKNDDSIKKFFKAVLNKSAMVGLRGEITANYLKGLGFVPEKHFTVIGCPSLYMNRELKIRDTNISPDSRVAFNLSPFANEETVSYILNNAKLFREYYYIPQNLSDLKVMYAGAKRGGIKTESFPTDFFNPIFKDDHARFPNSFTTWQRFMKTLDFSFGTRLHGNIAGVVSGTPTLHIAFDARTQEVTNYHHLAHVSLKDVQNSKNIFDLIEKVDFHEPEKYQEANFNHYIDFLNANGLRHIYLPGETAQLEKELENVKFKGMLTPTSAERPQIILERMQNYSAYINNRVMKKK